MIYIWILFAYVKILLMHSVYMLCIAYKQTKQKHVLFPWKYMQFFALISEITELDPECKQERLGTNSTPGSSPKCREITCKYLKSLNTLTSLQKGSRNSFRSEHRNKNKTKKNTYQQNNSTPNEANTSIPYQWGPTREEISKHFCPTLCSIGAWCGAIICDIPCVHYSL